MVHRHPPFRTSAYLLIGLFSPTTAPLAAPESVAYLSLYYAEQATHKAKNDYLLLVDGRRIAIKSGGLNPPQSRVMTSWNDFYKKSEDPPSSDLKLEIKNAIPKELVVCLSGRCAKVIRVCPPVKLRPSRPCLPPELINDIEKVE